MDLHGVEHVQLNALGGADTITVNDLTGTDVNQIAIDLGSPPGSGSGDGQVDTVVINATAGADVITLTDNNGVVTVSGLAETITITGFDPTDKIVINGLGGDDVIQASGLGTAMQLTANGGDGRRRPDRKCRKRHTDRRRGRRRPDWWSGTGHPGRRSRQQHPAARCRNPTACRYHIYTRGAGSGPDLGSIICAIQRQQSD